MKKLFIVGLLCALVACSVAVQKNGKQAYTKPLKTFDESLLFLYRQSAENWPSPFIDSGVLWTELGIVPQSPLLPELEKMAHKIELGKLLFFDPRLSGSAKISCATCHIPALSWTDGREKSAGHEGQLNKRNAPTILNTWFYKQLFWDGRSGSLEDQAFSPINSESEMHGSMSGVMQTLRRIEAYQPLFQKAFGTPEISPETLTEALAAFERTLTSDRAAFDRFLEGDNAALTPAALRGLHLFRTKARCMNCHHGPLLTDNLYHNTGTANNDLQEDLGRYNVTHKDDDAGRFRTPSLRDVLLTKPWMHNGLFADMNEIIDRYNTGLSVQSKKLKEEKDTLLSKVDPLIKPLHLTRQEKADLFAFLESITAPPPTFVNPVLPK